MPFLLTPLDDYTVWRIFAAFSLVEAETNMLIIGLTGSIAMGKSSATRYLAGKGLPVFSADDAVHALYKRRARKLIAKAFPGSKSHGAIDRNILAKMLVAEPHRLADLEAIIHPLVEEMRIGFIQEHLDAATKRIVLDIPLLFEKNFEDKVDVILVLTAPREIQLERVMKRPKMTSEKFAMIDSHQLKDEEKRQRADFVIDTSGPFEETYARLDQFLESVETWPQKVAAKFV